MSILKVYTPINTMSLLKKIDTPSLCITSDTPRLAEIQKKEGDSKATAILEMWILDVNDFFNVQNKMKPNQIKETALMILQDFYYMNIADINLVFTSAKKGIYGNLYGSLDGSKIYRWFDLHDKERANACYQEHLKEHDIIKSQE